MRLLSHTTVMLCFTFISIGWTQSAPPPATPTGTDAAPVTTSTTDPNPPSVGTNPAQQVIDQAGVAAQWEQDYKRLKALGTAYIGVIMSRGNGPAGWQDLPQTPDFAALQQAGCVVQWSKHFRDAKNGTSQFALAYLPDAPEKGGAVLLMDGAVSRLSAQEVKDLLAAQGQ